MATLQQQGHMKNYKAVQTFKRLKNTTDESILGLLDKTNLDVINENSNKNAILASTQRDLIAGKYQRILLEEC